MCPMWQPKLPPPRLEKYCCLSHDAQTVMTALHGVYQQHRQQIIHQQKVKVQQDPGQYYQSIYKVCFEGGDDCPDRSQASQQSMFNRYRHQSLPQFNSKMNLQRDYVPCSQNSLDKRQENQPCGDYRQSGINCGNSMFSQLAIVPLADQNNKIIVPSQPLVPTIVSQQTRPSSSSDFVRSGQGSYQLGIPYNVTEFHAVPSVPGIPDMDYSDSESNCSFYQKKLEEENQISKYFTEANSGTKINQEKENHLPLAKSRTECRDKKATSVVENRPNELENTSLSVSEIAEGAKKRKPVCSIAKKLLEHKSAGKELKANTKLETEQSSIPETNHCIQTQILHDGQPSKRKSNNFFAPFKRPKLSIFQQPEDSAQLGESKCNIPSIYDLCTEKQKMEDYLNCCEELVLALLYKDGSSQLGDPISADAKKIKPCLQRMRATSDVKGLAVLIYRREEPVSFMIPVHAGDCQEADQIWVRQFIESIFQHGRRKVCFGAKDIIHVLMSSFNFNQQTVFTDFTMLDLKVAAWLLDPDHPPSSFTAVLSKVNLLHKEVPTQKAKPLLLESMRLAGVAMQRLYQKLYSRDMWDLFLCVETKLVPLLAVMEKRCVGIDMKKLLAFSDILKKKLKKLEQKAFSIAGHSFVLFEELKLDSKLPQRIHLAKTSTSHQTSTSESVLSHLVNIHPLPATILEYRQLQKLKSTYVDGISSSVKDGSLSTHWDQTAAATGRLTSYQPNIQAVPKVPVTIIDYEDNFIAGRDSDDEMIIYAREPFVSKPGYSFVAADFQQIELRLLCHLADDSVMINMFKMNGDKDIFVELTSEWLGKSSEEVTIVEREQTKRLVYSVMYGAGKDKLADSLKISPDNAKAIMTSFLAKFPAVNCFTKQCVEFCQENGFTKTIFNRRRIIPNINSSHPPLRAQAERQAVNFCVQGSAADLCKAAMLQVEDSLNKRPNINARLLIQIHDELLLEVEDKDLTQVEGLLREVMECAETLCGSMQKLKVPIRISLSVGKSWAHMTPI
ncbi:hypothetical protein ScPMuIL_001478 [Solemya velum]